MANEKLLPSELNVKGTEAVEASIKDDLEVPDPSIEAAQAALEEPDEDENNKS
jgi:hypothetical protein